MDQIIYNAPATSQVVAIWVNDEPSENVETCDISIYAYSTSKHNAIILDVITLSNTLCYIPILSMVGIGVVKELLNYINMMILVL